MMKYLGGLIAAIVLLSSFFSPAAAQQPPGVDTTPLRSTLMLTEGWKFIQDDDLSDDEALEATGAGWETVTLPHTWNAEDAATPEGGEYKRGLGWYRLEFPSPEVGATHWLEFGAASLVADAWLNGEFLGQHKGGFTTFRFDITENLAESGMNVLLVKVNNTEPQDDEDITAIAPIRGDFNVSGGLYRYVSLVSTTNPVHFALNDSGALGVYATTNAITESSAAVNVRTLVRSDAETAGDYLVRVALADDSGEAAASAEQKISLEAGNTQEVIVDLTVDNPHLWNGKADPYQYQLVADLLGADGTPVDRVVQNFGIREMRFDPNLGFFLNGEHLRLHGVAIHQDYQGKGWALSDEDWDTSYDLIMEMGANAVRLGHYPFPQYALEKANELGMVTWAETALGLSTTVERCSTTDATEEFVENARQQLTELILQEYNHASIAVWAVGNETTARKLVCEDPFDNVRPVLQLLHETAKELDPNRVTVYAEFPHDVERSGLFATEGITDIFATNRYYLWYSEGIEGLHETLDGLHELTPDQPLGVSEYGAGAAITHHTDNWLAGNPDANSADEGEVAYQPEEYAAYVHEQDYRVIESKDYLWGAFIWNMFDFGSAGRNEGDVLGVNTKGLVTFDRQTRKDPFFFYKANWSSEPTTYIVGRRHTERMYALNDVKVYSNADSVQLTVNGTVIGTLTGEECEFNTCLFPDVLLRKGTNTITAVGNHTGTQISDEVTWNFNQEDINIAAGQLMSGLVSSEGDRFGSDKFYDNGTHTREGVDGEITNTLEPDLYRKFRRDSFSYEIPVEDGTYEVTLGFLEPNDTTGVGERIFDVTANGETLLDNFDVREVTGEARRVITRSFTVEVTGGLLTLDFVPEERNAIVSTIMVHRIAGENE